MNMRPIRVQNPALLGAPAFVGGPIGGAPLFRGPQVQGGPRTGGPSLSGSLFLGQESSTKSQAATALENARATFNRVAASYDNLAVSMGKESADQAYSQAADSLKQAQETYDSL